MDECQVRLDRGRGLARRPVKIEFERLEEFVASPTREPAVIRLRTAADIESRLEFYNVGPDQIPALLAFGVADPDGGPPCFVTILTTEPMALEPNSALCGPRTTSMRSTFTVERCPKSYSPPKLFASTPSMSTIE